MSLPSCSRPAEERLEFHRIRFLAFGLMAIGLIGLLCAGLLGKNDPGVLAFSWLWAFIVCFTICMGSLFWVLLHHAVDANWSVVIRRIAETVACLAPIMALLFIPLIFLAPDLWEWMKVPLGADVLIDEKRKFLNQPFFYSRTAWYFIFFSVAAWALWKLSVSQDRTGAIQNTMQMRKFSYFCIPLFALSISFAGIDWLMSLNPHWYSTIWGVYIFAGAIQSSMAVFILVANILRRYGYFKEVFTPEHNHIMGKLLFAFTIFWAYIAFSQYMLQYYANIPEETIFYLNRNAGTWRYLSIALVCGHFFIPFFLLLSQPAKKNPLRICFASAWILVFHAADHFWIIMPQHQVNLVKRGLLYDAQMGFSIHLTDVLCIIGMPCLLIGIFLWLLSRNALFPIRDPRLYESVNLVN